MDGLEDRRTTQPRGLGGRLRTIGAVIAVLAGMPASAHAGCVWSDLVRDEARAASVLPGAPRTHFIQDEVFVRGCPNDSAACRARAFLVPGDVVLTGPTQGAFVCAGFAGAKGAATIGWLPAAALAPLPEAEQSPADWAGHWAAPEQDITIRPARDGRLTVKGDATWGMGNPERLRRGGVHIGEMAGEARPEGGVLAFTMGPDGATLPYATGDEFDCRIRMLRRGPYLVVRDNNGCGGMNVTFSGFYRRTR
ncbi:hypothetical protein [Roseomonas sp. WA12]